MTSGTVTYESRTPKAKIHDANSLGHRRYPIYTVSEPDRFLITEFSQPENLHAAYRLLEQTGGSAPGVDGLSFEDFSPSEIYAALRCVSQAI